MIGLDMSIGNLTMLNAVIPSYDNGKDELDADNPENQEKINQLLGF